MRFGKIGMAAVAAASLVSAPVMAQAQQPVSSAPEAARTGADASGENLEGGSGIILAILAAAAIIAGIIIAADGSDDTPISP